MKHIILIILLASNIYAQTTQEDICQFKKVIKNGWSDDNQTLNQKIIDLARVEIPRILEKLHEPIKADENQSAILRIPKLVLGRDAYTKLFSYTRYLVSQGKSKEVTDIYIKSYEGIAQTKMTSYIPLIFIIVLNMSIKESLNLDLDKRAFDDKNRMLLHTKLSKSLILNNDKLLEAIDSEKKLALYLTSQIKLEKSPRLLDNTHLKIFKQKWRQAILKDYKDLVHVIKNNTLEERITSKEQKYESISLLDDILMLFLGWKTELFHSMSISIDKKDYEKISQYYIDKDLTYATPKLNQTYQDYFDMVNNNKKLLQRLKEN